MRYLPRSDPVYRDVLHLDNKDKLVSYKINYPGLIIDTTSSINCMFLSFGELPGEADNDHREITGILSAPVVLDINLFGSEFYSILRMNPYIYGIHWRNKENGDTQTSRDFRMNIRELALGVKGRIGDRIEVAVIPSLESNIFVTGLEISYTL